MPGMLPQIDIDLTKLGEQLYKVASGNRLWLAPQVLRPSSGALPFAMQQQVTDAVLAIRFSTTEVPLAWGLQDSLVNSYSGPFDTLYVTVIKPSATAGAHLYLHAAQDVVLNYGNTSGLSPSVGGNNTSDFSAVSASQTAAYMSAVSGNSGGGYSASSNAQSSPASYSSPISQSSGNSGSAPRMGTVPNQTFNGYGYRRG